MKPLKIYFCDYRHDGAGSLIKRAGDYVSEAEHKHSARFLSPHRKTSYLAGRALRRYAIAETQSRAASRNKLARHTSISHSAGLSCAVVSDCAIGIDLETKSNSRKMLKIAAHYFHEQECKAISAQSSPETKSALALQLWTLKEAYAKAKGIGLALRLGDTWFSARSSTPRAHLIETKSAPPEEAWHFSTMDFQGDFLLSVASNQQAAPKIETQALFC